MEQALEDVQADIVNLLDFIEMFKWGVLGTTLSQRQSTAFVRIAGLQRKGKKAVRDVEMTRRTSRVAQETVRSGFTYLFGLATVRLWSALEAAIGDFCLARLEHEALWKQKHILKSAKAELLDFVSRTEPEQIALVLELIVDRTKAKGAPGAGRFEAVLNELALGGGVPEAIERRLVWLSTARHCLVHRQGRIDSIVLKTFPEAGTKGDKLKVQEHEFARSVAAVRAYVATVGIRLEAAGLSDSRQGRHDVLQRLTKKMDHNDAMSASSMKE